MGRSLVIITPAGAQGCIIHVFAVCGTPGRYVAGYLGRKNLVPELSLPSWALTISLFVFVDWGKSQWGSLSAWMVCVNTFSFEPTSSLQEDERLWEEWTWTFEPKINKSTQEQHHGQLCNKASSQDVCGGKIQQTLDLPFSTELLESLLHSKC